MEFVMELVRILRMSSDHLSPVMAPIQVGASLAAAVLLGSSSGAAAGGAVVAPAEVPDVEAEAEKREQAVRREMQTAVMPAGMRAVVAGSLEPVWVYARMRTADSPEAELSVDADLTEGIAFRVVDGGSGVVLGEKRTIGDWVAVPVWVTPPADGAEVQGRVRIAAERIAGLRFYRKTLGLAVVGG